jgi:hypothetical protein
MEAGGLYIGSGHVIGVVQRSEGEPYWYVHLRRRGDRVEQLAQGEAADVAALVKAVGTRVPWVVVFDGPRVIHRLVQVKATAEEALAAAFPNAPLDQLLVSGHSTGTHHAFSMVRAEEVAPIRSAMQAAGARLVDLSVGPWCLLELHPLVDPEAYGDGIGGHCFTLEDRSLVAHHRVELPPGVRQIGDTEVAEEAVLAWAAAWAYLVPSAQRVQPLGTPCAADRAQERARVWYERVLLGAAALIMLLLGLDIGLRQATQATGAAQAAVRTAHAAAMKEVGALEQQVAEREALLAQLGNARQGALAARMALVLADVPRGIRLDRVQVEPLVAPLRDREPMDIHQGRTVLEGTCGDPALLSQWVNALQHTQQAGTVRMTGYGVETGGTHPRFQITVEP